MTTKHLMMAALLAAAFAPAQAGNLESPSEPAVGFHLESFDSDDEPNGSEAGARVFETFHLRGPMPHGARVVKNAPYSGEAVSEQLQQLADGNQISKKSTTLHFRDSAGRTRQEVSGADGKLRTVTIHDPVEGATYILNPATKSATKIGSRREIAAIAAERASRHAAAAGEKARMAVEKIQREGGHEVIVKRIERNEGEPGTRIRENVRIRMATNLEGHPMPGVELGERLGPMIAGAFGDMRWSGKSSSKDLGTREIDGVKAQGKLRSYEIPAGEIGNRNAIVVSTETWYAPELQVTLSSKHSDPRSGERSYRLASLKREEPPAALFQVPADYKVKDVMTAIRKIEIKK